MFTVDDLVSLTAIVSDAWLAAADLDWSVSAGTLDWSCLHTADHAVDCIWAPVFFLAAHRTDRYPAAGSNIELGDDATPESLVDGAASGALDEHAPSTNTIESINARVCISQ